MNHEWATGSFPPRLFGQNEFSKAASWDFGGVDGHVALPYRPREQLTG
jgi:hypothetical protein